MDHITGFPDLPAPAWALQDLEGKRRERMGNFFSASSLLCRPPSSRPCGSGHDRGFPPLLVLGAGMFCGASLNPIHMAVNSPFIKIPLSESSERELVVL